MGAKGQNETETLPDVDWLTSQVYVIRRVVAAELGACILGQESVFVHYNSI